MEKISINQVVAALRSDQESAITIVRSTGLKGTVKLIDRCCSGFTYNKFTPKEKTAFMQRNDNSEFGKHTLNGTMPIIDLDKDQQLTILISHIIYFNGKKVIH
jgi:hypothetical protein